MTATQAIFAVSAATVLGGFAGFYLVQGFRTGTIRVLHWRTIYAKRERQPALFWWLAFYNTAMAAMSVMLAVRSVPALIGG